MGTRVGGEGGTVGRGAAAGAAMAAVVVASLVTAAVVMRLQRRHREREEGRWAPRHQTELEPPHGNALQACVATVLGLELADVPNFAREQDLYVALREFLATRGLGFVKISVDAATSRVPFAPSAKQTLCLAAGSSPRGDHRHVVVAALDAHDTLPRFVFDPHPDGRMLRDVQWVGLFTSVVRPPPSLSRHDDDVLVKHEARDRRQ